MTRIKGVRKKLKNELGILVTAVHIRENLDLAPNAYRISPAGVTVGEAEIYLERELAINPGQVYGSINGIAGLVFVFGFVVVWFVFVLCVFVLFLGFFVVVVCLVFVLFLCLFLLV